MEHKGDEVARNEDTWVREGSYARVFRADGSDDAREAEVDACCEECGADSEADDLDEERVLNELSATLTLRSFSRPAYEC